MTDALVTVTDKIMFRNRAITEILNDELKNMAHIKHSRHRSIVNFTMNFVSVLVAYCLSSKKLMFALYWCNTLVLITTY